MGDNAGKTKVLAAHRDLLLVTAQPAQLLLVPGTPTQQDSPLPQLGDWGRSCGLGTDWLLGAAGGAPGTPFGSSQAFCAGVCFHCWCSPPWPSLCCTKASHFHTVLPGDVSCCFQVTFWLCFPAYAKQGSSWASPCFFAPSAAAGVWKEEAPPQPRLLRKESRIPACAKSLGQQQRGEGFFSLSSKACCRESGLRFKSHRDTHRLAFLCFPMSV